MVPENPKEIREESGKLYRRLPKRKGKEKMIFYYNSSPALPRLTILLHKLKIIPDMDEIITGLYVGSITDAQSGNIDIKICVLNENEICPSGTIHIPILKIRNNTIDYLIKENLDKIANIIDDTLKNGKKVLVFCMAGIDRSPFAVVYYLISKRNMMAHEAYNLIKQKRKMINQHWEWFGMVK